MYYIIKTNNGHWLRAYSLLERTFTADWVMNPADKGYFFAEDLPVIFANTTHTTLKVYQIQRTGTVQPIDFQKSEGWNVCLN